MNRAVPMLLSSLLLSLPAAAAPETLPLPNAPVMLRIGDVGAFDRALSGGLRKAMSGRLPAIDPAGAAWRRTRVGGKLEAQWAQLSADIGLGWPELMALKPTEIGLAVLSPGNLETVLAVRTPLAVLPWKLPGGTAKVHAGTSYHLVVRGAGDDRTLDRRLGLAWARTGGVLLIATSERAILLALERSGESLFPAEPSGFAQLRLDMDELRKDRYFRREYLFPEGRSATGIVFCALRADDGGLVELRDGESGAAPPAGRWATAGRHVQGAGWESDGARLFPALRRAFLEPVPSPSLHPGLTTQPLPSTEGLAGEKYQVDLTRPVTAANKPGDAELPEWSAFLGGLSIAGWGWELDESGAVRLVVQMPPQHDGRFLDLAVASLQRRSGLVSREGSVLRVGPGLPALAIRRTGDWLWIGRRPEELEGLPVPARDGDLVRWGAVDAALLKREARGWAEAEGAFSPDTTRPFSDRILGLLGWAPALRAVSVERRVTGSRFQEKVVFTLAPPPASKPSPSPAAKRTPAKTPKRG